MCFAVVCVLTVDILFNVTEVARLWAVDERVHVLRPVLWKRNGSMEEDSCMSV